MSYEFMTETVWERIGPLLPPRNTFGRPRCTDRDVLEGILWVLKTGARWRDLPKTLPSGPTCWRRLRDWEEDGIWDAVWLAFIRTLDEQQTLDWEECFIDGSFAPAKKGGSASERRNVAREQSGWWWRTARVFLWEAPWRARRPQK